METDGSLFGLIFGAAIQLAFTAGLYAWARYAARDRPGFVWRASPYLPLAGFVFWNLGGLVGVLLLTAAFDGLDGIEASRKAEVLAREISSAMNASAILFGLGALFYLASLVLSTVGTLKKRPALAEP
jgi:hypothetical protein